jgi:hypothetical protein
MPISIEDIINAVHKETADWSEEDQTEFFLAPIHGESLIRFHHSLGRYIRNKYNLWELKWNPVLVNGVDHSPYHPDAVSQTIVEEVWKRGIYKDKDYV